MAESAKVELPIDKKSFNLTQEVPAKSKESEYNTVSSKVPEDLGRAINEDGMSGASGRAANKNNKMMAAISSKQSGYQTQTKVATKPPAEELPKPRPGRRTAADGSTERTAVVNIYETSQQREAAGVNVSYDSSFSAIKSNIFNFKGGLRDQALKAVAQVRQQNQERSADAKQAPLFQVEKNPNSQEDAPNKPVDKSLVKNASH